MADIRTRLARWMPGSAWMVGLVSTAGAAMFAVIRLLALGGGTGRFVVAGSQFTDRATVPGRIPVADGGGYDGQFMYRLALHPLHLHLAKSYGITLDVPYRVGRIGYPFVVWLASFGGQASLAPTMMVVVNVLAVGVLGYAGARLAMDREFAPAWGFLIAGFWGFGFVLARDLGELVAAAAVFSALVCIGRARYLPAAALLALAVLTREQEVLSVAAVSIGVAVPALRDRRWADALRRLVALAALPAAAFLAWQGWGAHVVGKLPASTSAKNNTVFPGSDLPHAFMRWVHAFGHSVDSRFALLCALALAALVVAAATSPGLRRSWATRPWETLMAASALLVFVSSSAFVIDIPADFRQLSELAGGCWLILWCAKTRRTAWLATAVVPITGLVFAARALVL